MKTKLLVLFLVLFIAISHAQVGIGTTDPVSTLDVTGNPSDASSLCGITPPRVSGDELAAKAYTPSQNGTIVYATSAATTPSGQTSNVTSEGIYVFSGSQNKWMGLNVSTYSGNSQMMMRKLGSVASGESYEVTNVTTAPFNFGNEVFNSITGASYNSTTKRLTLPVGTYMIKSHLTPGDKYYFDWVLRLNGTASVNSTIGTAIANSLNQDFGTAPQEAIITINNSTDYIDFIILGGRRSGNSSLSLYNNQSYLMITRIQ